MKITPPELTEAKLKEYIKDRMLFRKEQFVMEASADMPDGGLFGEVCQPWQIEYIYKPIDLRDERGFPKYRVLYLQLPKKWGKTALMGGESIVQFVLNEFWNQPDRDLWDTMYLGMAAKPYSQGIILTNAGFDQKTICYEIRELARSQEFEENLYFEPNGVFLESLKNHCIT